MLKMLNGFEMTDNDCMRCGKEIEPRKFLFIQAIRMDMESKENEYVVVADTVDVSKMSLDDIECAICGYYDGIKEMEESNNMPLGQLDFLIAECAFESNPYCSWEYKSECVSWDRAEKIIQIFIETDGKYFKTINMKYYRIYEDGITYLLGINHDKKIFSVGSFKGKPQDKIINDYVPIRIEQYRNEISRVGVKYQFISNCLPNYDVSV